MDGLSALFKCFPQEELRRYAHLIFNMRVYDLPYENSVAVVRDFQLAALKAILDLDPNAANREKRKFYLAWNREEIPVLIAHL